MGQTDKRERCEIERCYMKAWGSVRVRGRVDVDYFVYWLHLGSKLEG